MATYFVASGGSNTAPYDTWAKAATSLATALAAATSAGDVVVIQYNAVPTADSALGADTTYTFAANIFLIAASNDGGSAYTPTAMNGTTNFIGSSSASWHITLSGADRAFYAYGIALRVAGTGGKEIRLGNSVGFNATFDTCYFWTETTSGVGYQYLTFNIDAHNNFRNCTFRFGNTGQGFNVGQGGFVVMEKCTISSSGSVPTTLFISGNNRQTLQFVGCDFSHCTGTIVANMGSHFEYFFDRCYFGSGATPFATQTSNPTQGSGEAWYSDCIFGTTRWWGHYNALGSTVKETGIYYTGSSAGNESWKIVGTSNATPRAPYKSPWLDWYNTGTSAITPRFEILRDGSTTAYTDAQVWAEFSWKNTASSPLASGLQNDWQGMAAAAAGTAGTDQAAGAGTGSWTGEAASAWSGKCDSGSAITPTESGALRGRIAVASNITVYVDPVVRTA